MYSTRFAVYCICMWSSVPSKTMVMKKPTALIWTSNSEKHKQKRLEREQKQKRKATSSKRKQKCDLNASAQNHRLTPEGKFAFNGEVQNWYKEKVCVSRVRGASGQYLLFPSSNAMKYMDCYCYILKLP